VDLLIAARRLRAELIAGDVDSLKALVAEFLTDLLNSPVLSGEASLVRGVDKENDFAAKRIERKIAPLPVSEREVVNVHH